MQRPRKVFTLEEARALVPRLRALVTAIQHERRELAVETQRLEDLTPAMRSDGFRAEAERHEARIGELRDAIKVQVRQLVAIGVEVKDLDTGLLDFPSLRDGRVVYLCWRVDEPTVAYWHELETGFQGRRPLTPDES